MRRPRVTFNRSLPAPDPNMTRVTTAFLAAVSVLCSASGQAQAGSGVPPAGSWMFGPFEKPTAVNLIIAPSASATFMSPITDSAVRWEELATVNPAAEVKNGKTYVIERAEDGPGKKEQGF